tara:strand:- start:270 stop:797 length:528 start_codon:yes stop_codon:yes gene_type:complete
MEGQTMATRRVKLTGIAEWAKVFTQNRDMLGFEEAYVSCDGACTIDVILDEANMALLKASKSMKRGKADPQGRGTMVRLIRKFDTGFDWASGPPVVLKPNGEAWDYDMDGTIGNGSTVEVILSVYDTKMKSIVGTRLDTVKVLTLVEYVPDDGDIEIASVPTAESPALDNSEVMF